MKKVTVKVFAKLNLSLEITGINKRGYHDLDMLCVSVDVCDTVTVKKAESISVTMDGAACGKENTAYRAALLVSEACGVNLAVEITKGIPMGAGMGGSSADASAVFAAAVKEGLITEEQAYGLCTMVGSDVAYMMRGGYCRIHGEGEKIIPLGDRELQFAIVQKSMGASTAAVYAGYDELPQKGAGIDEVLDGGDFYNVLTKSASERCPQIDEILQRMRRLFGNATMTGSGSAVFSVVSPEVSQSYLDEQFDDCVFVKRTRTRDKGIIFG